jgi:hypothetical protein
MFLHQVDQFDRVQVGRLQAELLSQFPNSIPEVFPLLLVLGVFLSAVMESFLDVGQPICLFLEFADLGGR